MHAIQTTITNAAGLAIPLFWRFSATKGYVVVFGEIPGQGPIYMGDTMTEAKTAARESTWKPQ